MSFRFARPAFLFFLLVLSLLGRVAQAGLPAAGATPSLGEALNPDGTLRAGASGSFDAREFTMQTAADGRPMFRPSGAKGAGDYRWADGLNLPDGANGPVYTVVCAGTATYFGGSFSAVGNAAAKNIAKWDGTAWSALGTGIGNGVSYDVVNALAVSGNGELYAGGTFSQAGGIVANNIARWNGTAWSALGAGAANGVNGGVAALAIAGTGGVYVGGSFTQAGSIGANNIAQWNGTSWNSLGTGIANGANSGVSALIVARSGEVYAGGGFTQAGGIAANGIAKWNGTAWSSLGIGTANGVNNGVGAVALSGAGDVYVGGNFTRAGGMVASNVAKWNGTSWSALGAAPGYGLSGYVNALAVSVSGELYVGGYFLGNNTGGHVMKWNGTVWNVLGTGLVTYSNSAAYALAASGNGELYVGGTFTQTAGIAASRVTKWNGTTWSSLGTGIGNGANSYVEAVAVSGRGDVYVGGSFTQVGGIIANQVAKWNGTTWSALGAGTGLGNGVNGTIYTLAVSGSSEVYVGGDFTQAGGIAAYRVAKWDGTTWSGLGTPTNNGVGGTVYALAVSSRGEVYVGGNFTQTASIAANGLAKWDGTNWSSLGTGAANGVTGAVTVIKVAGSGEVYVGGAFTQAGGIAANNVAKWNGTAWSSLGIGAANGVDNTVSALAVSGSGEVYAGGSFAHAGGIAATRVAKWNGTTWSALGTGIGSGVSDYVRTLAVSGSGEVYAGGIFVQAGGIVANNVAHWNGTGWSSLGTGLNSFVRSVGVGANNKVYFGGGFGGVGDISKASVCFAIYDPAAVSATAPAARPALTLTPNPAHGPATLTLPPAATARAGQVLDELGRVVRAFVVPAQAGTALLPVGGLPAGAYVVRVGAASGRLVVE